jgi:hypothetical protein
LQVGKRSPNNRTTLGFFKIFFLCLRKICTGNQHFALPLLKNTTNQQMHKESLSIVTHSYMFRPCWVIFREDFSLPLH